LTKNYDVAKEPDFQGGLHNLWAVYKATKKDKSMQEVSVFTFEKKLVDKKASASVKEEIFDLLKKDANSLAKFRHPGLLNLIQTPLEDQKMIVYVTEPVECNLASLFSDPSKKHLIPGDLEIKCIILELLEVLNFLHQTAKTIHLNLSPENLYLTKEGKLKLAGFNFF